MCSFITFSFLTNSSSKAPRSALVSGCSPSWIQGTTTQDHGTQDPCHLSCFKPEVEPDRPALPQCLTLGSPGATGSAATQSERAGSVGDAEATKT